MSLPRSVDWDVSGVKRAEREIPPYRIEDRHIPSVLKVRESPWLTPTQLEVVRLLSVGLSPKEIATERELALGTVKLYMFQARNRAQCKTTAHLTAEYVRRVECPAPSATPTTR